MSSGRTVVNAMMPVTDSMFLIVETREHPMHVGGLQLFELPEGAGPDYLSGLYRRLVESQDVHELFLRTPQRGLTSFGQWSWRQDQHIDLEYHVRFSALPRPGRVRELLALVSRLHGTLLDRHRPLWELHLIEGLEGNRFAVYTKVHHAVLDGVSALRWVQRGLSEDPDETDMPAVFGLPKQARRPAGDLVKRGLGHQARQLVEDVAGLPAILADAVTKGLSDPERKLPFQAPKTLLNGSITGARRFAAQDWPISRINAARTRHAATHNDVVLAMCSGALRSYLLELDALPEQGMVAAVPVSLRSKETTGRSGQPESGNSIGFTLADLATDEADPTIRMKRIQESMRAAKRGLAGRSPLQILALSALTIAPLGLSPIPGFVDRTRPPFNVIISNVPGPGRTLYWNGARMQGVYPLSIVLDGQALNITVTTYAGRLHFGLTGCRRNVPHLQRLLTYLEEALAELETDDITDTDDIADASDIADTVNAGDGAESGAQQG
jgi:WS/DGAT/MGAT family acyltransferase